MPDVVKIAMERREALLKEVTALEKFIRIANELLSQAAAKDAGGAGKPKTTLKPAPAAERARIIPSAPAVSVETTSASQTEAFLKSHSIETPKTPASSG